MARLKCTGHIVPDHYLLDTQSLAIELRNRLGRGWFHPASQPEAERLDSLITAFMAVSEDAIERDLVAKMAASLSDVASATVATR